MVYKQSIDYAISFKVKKNNFNFSSGNGNPQYDPLAENRSTGQGQMTRFLDTGHSEYLVFVQEVAVWFTLGPLPANWLVSIGLPRSCPRTQWSVLSIQLTGSPTGREKRTKLKVTQGFAIVNQYTHSLHCNFEETRFDR